MNDAVLSTIRSSMHRIRVPHAQEAVYKDECVVSFDRLHTKLLDNVLLIHYLALILLMVSM